MIYLYCLAAILAVRALGWTRLLGIPDAVACWAWCGGMIAMIRTLLWFARPA